MNRFANSLPLQYGVLAIMPAAITVIALVLLVAALISICMFTLKRGVDHGRIEFSIRKDRRTPEQRCCGTLIEQQFEDMRRTRGVDDFGRLKPEPREPRDPFIPPYARVVNLRSYAVKRQGG